MSLDNRESWIKRDIKLIQKTRGNGLLDKIRESRRDRQYPNTYRDAAKDMIETEENISNIASVDLLNNLLDQNILEREGIEDLMEAVSVTGKLTDNDWYDLGSWKF